MSHAPISEIADAVRARLAAGSAAPLLSLTRTEQVELLALYEPGAQAPLWTDRRGKPTASARDALALLEGAANEGLDPQDYASASFGALSTTLEAAQRPSVADIVAFDVGMSSSTLRYFRHLHLGRVDPRTMGFNLNVPRDGHDFVMLLRAALADGRITETASGLAPPLVQYRQLRTTLARYRALAADTNLQALPPLSRTVRPGDSYIGLRALHRRLAALGDIPAGIGPPGDTGRYEGPLVEAVKRFQIRHGLQDDGVLGTSTHAALTVPLAWRVRQIELALERFRWLPDLGDRPFLALNIPMFYLWGWDSIPPTGEPSFGMRAIVGRAISTQTPIFVGDMTYVTFRPYWNVPRSILRNEMLPLIERDSDYLRRQKMEIVRGPGDDAAPVSATPENVELLRQGVLRLRQRPGPGNALGLVKFVFPNDENVYLHGTPAQELFGRTRRDFSHGCVRVEDPVALAAWVLKDQPEWTRDRILAAMAAPASRRVNVSHPIQVILFYVTAVVMPDDGTIRFAEDIYGHDTTLDHALGRQQG